VEKERTANIGLVLWRGNIPAHTRHRNQAFYRYKQGGLGTSHQKVTMSIET